MALNSSMRRTGLGATRIIFIDDVQLGQMRLHSVGRHEWEPSVHAILREVVRERAEEETTEHASEAGTVGIALAVVKAPSGHVVWRVVLSEEPVPSGEGDGVA